MMEIDTLSEDKTIYVASAEEPQPRCVPFEDNNEQMELQLINCCCCGSSILANPAGACLMCLSNRTDPTEGIERSLVLPYCRYCGRYQRPPWLACEWESPELLALCLKRIRGLRSMKRSARLVGASFLYTESHSRRVKVKLTMQTEAAGSAVVEQDCVVEFIVQATQCDDCKRAFTPHTWVAVVQVRQRAQHKRTMMYLEQVILKRNAAEKVLKIVSAPDGLDFQFASKANAARFVDFVTGQVPCRGKSSKQLISHDPKSNTAFNKHAFMVEIAPICKDDLVFIPHRIGASIYGGISPFVLCTRVTSMLQLVDPFTLRGVDVSSDKYWKHPFQALLNRRHMTEFIVLNIEPVDMRTISVAAHAKRFVSLKKPAKATKPPDRLAAQPGVSTEQEPVSLGAQFHLNGSAAYQLIDVEVARASDFGVNDIRITVRSHMGRVLRVGDVCLGYDITRLNLAGSDEDCGTEKIPYEAILVRRARGLASQTRKRNWVLQRLFIEKSLSAPAKENIDAMVLEEFKQDLEEDAVMRSDVNLWRCPQAQADQNEPIDDEDSTAIKLCELLDGLSLEDQQQSDRIFE